jgi:hypothetical protein
MEKHVSKLNDKAAKRRVGGAVNRKDDIKNGISNYVLRPD